MNMQPAKTQIILDIRPVWSKTSLSAWRNLVSLAHSEDSDRAGWMPRLIWVRWANSSFCWFCNAATHFILGRTIYKFLNVCSEFFNKCYILTRNMTDEPGEMITWNRMKSLLCTDPGHSPLTIQSEAEQAFIGHYVQQYIQDRRYRNLDYLYIGKAFLDLLKTFMVQFVWILTEIN